jgi:hypothetical protein
MRRQSTARIEPYRALESSDGGKMVEGGGAGGSLEAGRPPFIVRTASIIINIFFGARTAIREESGLLV